MHDRGVGIMSSTTGQTSATGGSVTKPDPNLPLLGPLQYNRFLGNPGLVVDPETTIGAASKAFEAEMGYPWMVQVSSQGLLSKLDQLEQQNKELTLELSKVKVTAGGPKSHA